VSSPSSSMVKSIASRAVLASPFQLNRHIKSSIAAV
jgi:hypothetical protein